MSKMTFASYVRLHILQLKMEIIEYRKGYEYAKRFGHYQNKDISELVDLLHSFMEIGLKYKNYCAYGHAQAIRELIWEQCYGGVSV